MPRIINAFAGPDPLAQTLSDLGRAMYGDTASGAIKRAQQRSLERQNAETENLMRLTAEQGAQNLGSSPLAQAMILGGGVSPKDFGSLGLLGAATEFGAADPRTDNFAVGTGAPYRDTSAAYRQDFGEKQRQFDASLAENARQFDEKPLPALDLNGMPVFGAQSDLTTGGFQPVLSDAERKGTLAAQNWDRLPDLSPEQQTYLGADPKAAPNRSPKNYLAPDGTRHITYDGITDAQTNAPLPPGGGISGPADTLQSMGLTNSVLSDEQAKSLDYQRMDGLLNLAEGLTADPTRFGATGLARDYGQEAMQLVGNVSQMFGGKTPAEAVAKVRQEAAAQGIAPNLLPELYDPTLPQVDTVWGLLVYQGASALAGQSNRSVSDRDVQVFRQILGDPKSFFASAETMRAKIGIVREILQMNKAVTNQALGQNGAPAAPASPAAGAQPAAPPADNAVDWRTYFGR